MDPTTSALIRAALALDYASKEYKASCVYLAMMDVKKAAAAYRAAHPEAENV